MLFECPECGSELAHDDVFGNLNYVLALQGYRYRWAGAKKAGDIFKCANEECEAYWFHVLDREGVLREGYPC